MANRFFPNYSTYKITSPYGNRIHPVTGKKTMHRGIDLVAKTDSGTSATDYITAHTGGTVEAAGYDASCGNFVNIRVSDRSVMVYYHMKDTPYVKKGATVKAGDKLGYMGSTGTATGAHLHWGIKCDGSWIDPAPFLDKVYTEQSEVEATVKIEMAVLKKGSKGEQVKTLQRLLLAFGYKLGGYGADGSFGNATDADVRAFQKAKGLSVDGCVGQNTWNKLLKG